MDHFGVARCADAKAGLSRIRFALHMVARSLKLHACQLKGVGGEIKFKLLPLQGLDVR